ncbi:MAG TPA: hopanoid biosynthesis-associated protein HpnK [Xanthobacteraceae bacterium]|nr:hopanoid biosynthesis-associated protein HpnK [Xanthobacteraceae bacterium]
MNHLIINADDFGLSEPVNAAIEQAHRSGILSAASLMVGAPAAADAIERARALPNLRVGLHIVLVDGDPVTDRAHIPGLIDRSGRFRNDLARYGARIALDASVRRQVAEEIIAQFEAYQATGLPLDHVNAHRHFHLHPAVAAAVLSIGRQYGMRALRVPVEPWPVVAGIDPQTRRLIGRIAAPWAALMRGRFRRAGLTTADAVFGLAWSGAMTGTRLAALLGRLPPGLVEIYLHPAVTNAFAGAALGYRYAEEFAALCDPDCVAAVRRSGYTLGGYSDVGA